MQKREVSGDCRCELCRPRAAARYRDQWMGLALLVASLGALAWMLAGCGGVQLVVKATGDCRAVQDEPGGPPRLDCGVRLEGETLPPADIPAVLVVTSSASR